MNFIKFLGTAGARFVVAQQLRASGGIWLSLDNTNLLIDPGPGCLVRCFQSRPKLDPTALDGIILSHRHLDHSADVNVMMEAMTMGGKNKKGIVLAPREALFDDPVVLKYVRPYVQSVKVLSSKLKTKIGNLTVTAQIKHIHHEAETYGLVIRGKKHSITYIADTRFFPELIKAYKGAEILILSVMRFEGTYYDHLNVEEAEELIKKIKPKVAIMTHFGMQMLKAKPWLIAERMMKDLKIKVIAASDGLQYII